MFYELNQILFNWLDPHFPVTASALHVTPACTYEDHTQPQGRPLAVFFACCRIQNLITQHLVYWLKIYFQMEIIRHFITTAIILNTWFDRDLINMAETLQGLLSFKQYRIDLSYFNHESLIINPNESWRTYHHPNRFTYFSRHCRINCIPEHKLWQLD